MQDKTQKIQDSDSGVYGANVASEVHKELKKIGGVKPPQEFINKMLEIFERYIPHLKLSRSDISWRRMDEKEQSYS